MSPAGIVSARRRDCRSTAVPGICRGRHESHGVFRHHVRTIDEVGDPPEAFGLHCVKKPLSRVQAHEGGVLARLDSARRFQHRNAAAPRDGEMRVVQAAVVARATSCVERRRLESSSSASEDQRRARIEPLAGCGQGQARSERACDPRQFDVEIDGVDQERGRRVILEKGDLRRGVPASRIRLSGKGTKS